MMKTISVVFGVACLACTLQAETIVIGQPTAVGSGNCDPFGCPNFFGLGTYQQVYASTAFTAPFNIAQLDLYDFQVINGGMSAQGAYTLSFSYTSKAPGGLDLTNPNNNIGSGSQLFYSGPLPPATAGPNGRALAIVGTTFPYNPANGNLLLTITVSSPIDGVPPLYLGQAASTAQTTNAYFGTVNGVPMSGGNSTGGLVTGFTSLPLQFVGPKTLPAANVGVVYGPVTLLATGGAGGFTWTATGLPPSLNFTSAGILSGTPPLGSQGTYNATFTVTDSTNATVTTSLTLTINFNLAVTGPTSLPNAMVGAGYGPVTFAAIGGTGTYTWSATGLPGGLTFSSSGVLSGTPAANTQGNYSPQFTVTDSNKNTANIILPLVVNPAPLEIASPASLSPGTVGVTYTRVAFAATGGTSGYIWSAAGLPAGLSFSTIGVLSGTPAVATQGNYNPQFTVTDSSHNIASVTLPLLINPSTLQITGPASLPNGTAGAAYSPVTFTATGGTGGYTWSAIGLPAGLAISSAGVLSGTPAAGAQGAYSPMFTVTDSFQSTVSVTLPLVINGSTLQITGPSALPVGVATSPYGPVTFQATGGSGGYKWSATGLPKGLAFSAAGMLSGTPASTVVGTFSVPFTVTDSSLSTASVTLTLRINTNLQITGPRLLALGIVGSPYGPVPFSATGGIGPYTWTVNALPRGLTFSSAGILSGTPATLTTGIYILYFTVTDSTNTHATLSRVLTIFP